MPAIPHILSDQCTCAALRRAARNMTNLYDRGLAPAGLRTTQYSLLSRLAMAGPRSIQMLARDMGLDRTTLGRNLRPLERDGLVGLEVDPDDRRGRVVRVTAAGRERLAQADRLWAATQARFGEVYGAEPARRLHAMLDELSAIRLG